jgi:type I restriction enzyme S subunit
MEVKSGYKVTEVGLIPNDWGVGRLSSVCKGPMQNGLFFQPSRKGIGVRLINVGDLYGSAPIDYSTLELFNATDKECERFRVEDGDLFFTRSSLVSSGIAHCNIYCARETAPVVFDSHVIRLRPDRNQVVPSYLFRLCSASVARQYLVAHAKTATMTTIDQEVLGNCPVLVPPLPEQHAIADVLSDADSLIESLEQLIVKKRRIKQGAMRELLTGKTRLADFKARAGYKRTEVGLLPEDWDMMPFVRAVGSYIDYRGRTPRKLGLSWGGGDILALSANNVQMGGINPEKEAYFGSDELYRKWMVQGECERGDVLLTMEAPLGNIAQIPDSKKYILSQRVLLIKPKSWLLRDFLAHYMKGLFFQKQLHLNSTGSTAKGIQRRKLDELSIYFPPNKAEQKAIAAIMNDMDSEVATLETKLAKTRQIKQGMMQELFTGRIRLV